MVFKPGNPGKPKGTIHKRSLMYIECLEKRNFSIPDAMLDLCEILMRCFIEDRAKEEAGIYSPMESQAAKYIQAYSNTLIAMANFAYPKLKAIEQQKASIAAGMTTQQKLEAVSHMKGMLEEELKAKGGA